MKYKAKYSQLVMPDDANNVGTLFGGQMISWMDLAAAKVAYRFLKGTGASGALTRAIDQVEFKEPVFLGDWVNCESKVIRTGSSSLEIEIKAFAESKDHGQRLACTANITFVAVIRDDEGKLVKFNHNLNCE